MSYLSFVMANFLGKTSRDPTAKSKTDTVDFFSFGTVFAGVKERIVEKW